MKYEVWGYIVHKILSLSVGYESELCVYIYTIWNFNAVRSWQQAVDSLNP